MTNDGRIGSSKKGSGDVMSDTTPTLEELEQKMLALLNDKEFNESRESFENWFSLVASGQVKQLRGDSAMLAAQCVLVVLNHVRKKQEAKK
jgi:hypothetical protein